MTVWQSTQNGNLVSQQYRSVMMSHPKGKKGKKVPEGCCDKYKGNWVSSVVVPAGLKVQDRNLAFLYTLKYFYFLSRLFHNKNIYFFYVVI